MTAAAAAATLNVVTHEYSDAEGRLVPLSVSKVLQESGLAPAYPPEAMPAVEHARELGTAIHEWCEYLDRGGDDLSLLEDSEPLPYVLAYQRFRADHLPNWQFIEMPYHRDDCGGTPDRIGAFGKEIAICDIKTPKRIAKHWKIQLTGYQWITNLDKAHLYVVYLSSDATYRLLPYEADFRTWEAALQIARYKLK